MRTCSRCGGGIAEPGEVTGWAGKWCHCGWANDQFTVPHRFGTPYDSTSVEEYKQRMMEKGNVQKPKLSHIINLCEQLSQEELYALVKLLSAMHDSVSLAAAPNQFKKESEGLGSFVPNAPSPYDVKGL